MRSLLLVLLAATVAAAEDDPTATFADRIEPSAVLWVAADGDDGGDGSASRPFRTIVRAAREARPGTAIRLRPGSYTDSTYIEALQGTAEAPIWIGGAPGAERPVLRDAREILHLVRPRHVVVHDLVLEDARQYAINCDDGGRRDEPGAAAWLVLRDLLVRRVGSGGNQDAIKLAGVYDYRILRCRIESWSGSAIDQVGCHRGVIARCSFEGPRDDGPDNGVQCKGGSGDIAILWNRFGDCGDRGVNIGGSSGFDAFRPPPSREGVNAEARRIRVVGNLFVGSNAPFAFVGADDCVAAHNTVVDPKRWCYRLLLENDGAGKFPMSRGTGCILANNIFCYRAAALGEHANVGRGTEPAGLRLLGNLWYAYDRATQRPRLSAEEEGGIVGRDPRFVDRAGGDYRLLPGSPARDAGIAQDWIGSDMDGRRYGTRPSLGAFAAD